MQPIRSRGNAAVKHPLLICLTLMVCLPACSVFSRQDTQATLQAQNTAYVQEATGIALTGQQDQTAVQATAVAAGTHVAVANGVNQQLVATVRVLEPPTAMVIVANPTGIPVGVGGTPVVSPMPGTTPDFGVAPSAADSIQFVEVGVTDHVRDSDGCPDSVQTQFPQNISRIYVTTRAITVSAGTQMSVEWRRGDLLIASDSYSVDQDQTNYCLWFYIDASEVTMEPGNWSVQLSANGTPIQPVVSFSILQGG